MGTDKYNCHYSSDGSFSPTTEPDERKSTSSIDNIGVGQQSKIAFPIDGAGTWCSDVKVAAYNVIRLQENLWLVQLSEHFWMKLTSDELIADAWGE